MKNQWVKQDAILKKKKSFDGGSGNSECGHWKWRVTDDEGKLDVGLAKLRF